MKLKEFNPPLSDEYGIMHPSEDKCRSQYLYTDTAVDLAEWI